MNIRKARIRKFVRIFLGIAYDFWLESRIARKRGIKEARKKMSVRHRRRAIQFRATAIELGGLLIKLGQFFSARADVMPEEYLQELAKLQDEVPPVDFEEIKKVIEQSFGKPIGEVFLQIKETPEAAASLAQVHFATLHSGEAVAVKVQRPNIEELCDIDLATFSFLMEGVDRFTNWAKRVDVPGLVNEFKRTLGDELDFLREGSYADRFKENFKDDPDIFIPGVYSEYTNERVVTLEKVEGIKISDYQQLEESGFERSEVARKVMNSYLQQALINGFFHADPHPGNLFVLPDSRIAFVDFGMAGEITPEMREHLKSAVIAIARRDVQSLIVALQSLGFIRKGANIAPIKKALYWVFDNYQSLTSNNVDFEILDSIQEDIRTIIYEQPFNLPVEFAFLGRAVGTLVGLVKGLDQDFDIVEAAKPYIEKIAQSARADIPSLVLQQAKEIGLIAINIPKKVDDLLTQIEHGDIKVRVTDNELNRMLRRNEAAQRATIYSVLGAAFLISGVLISISQRDSLSLLFFSLAFVFILLSLIKRKSRFG